MTTDLEHLIATIIPVHADAQACRAAAAAQQRWATRAKPPGSLGRMEDLAVHIATITGNSPPRTPTAPAVLVFAGDHGVVADGASAWPSDITALMVETMAREEAAISAFARTVGARVTVVDVGVASDLSHVAGVVHAKVRAGTASISTGPAMTRSEALAAVAVGADTTLDAVAAGADLVIGGEMGIGNTTPSTALIAHLTGLPVAELVGPGAGLPAAALPGKRAIIERALRRCDGTEDPISVLAQLGGLEIAALVGLYLAAAAHRVPAIVDGVIAAAAVAVADALAPGVRDRVIAGHRSSEPAASAALDHLSLVPLLDLDLRLGEGTGACLAVPLVQAATRALREMADLPG